MTGIQGVGREPLALRDRENHSWLSRFKGPVLNARGLDGSSTCPLLASPADCPRSQGVGLNRLQNGDAVFVFTLLKL